MKHFTVLCFMLLILTTNALQDYVDYYDDDKLYQDDIDIRTLDVRLGSTVDLICIHGAVDVEWQHNGKTFTPFETEPPVTDWIGATASVTIQISSKNDTGIWKCQNSLSTIEVYKVRLSTGDDEPTDPAQRLDSYRYPTNEQETTTSKILLITPTLQHSSIEHSTLPTTVSLSINTTTITPSSSTIQHRSRTEEPVKGSKLLENKTGKLAFLIEKEMNYSIDNPFFKLKSITMAKSSSIQTSASPVIFLLLVIEMLVCLLRI